MIVYLVKGVILVFFIIFFMFFGGLDLIEVFCWEGGGKVIVEWLLFSNDGLERVYLGIESGFLSWIGFLLFYGLFGGVL